MNAKELVYKTTALIPKGKVLTYSSLANLSGVNNPRAAGSILHKNPDPARIPCHRVVSKKGFVAERYAFGGHFEQIRRLRSENVDVTGRKVDLSKYLWQPEKV